MDSGSSGKFRKARRKFTAEFKAEAVKLATQPGQSIGKVSRNLDLTETALRSWVKQAAADAGQEPCSAPALCSRLITIFRPIGMIPAVFTDLLLTQKSGHEWKLDRQGQKESDYGKIDL